MRTSVKGEIFLHQWQKRNNTTTVSTAVFLALATPSDRALVPSAIVTAAASDAALSVSVATCTGTHIPIKDSHCAGPLLLCTTLVMV